MVHLVRRWWTHPADFVWTSSYQRSKPLLRHAGLAMGVWCGLYAALCVLAVFTPAGAPSGVGRWVAEASAALAAVVGALWITRPWPDENASRAFVGFVEISSAAVLLTLVDPFVALPCASAFAVIGSYIAAFHSPRMIVGHYAWAALVVCTLLARTLGEPSADRVLVAAYAIVLWLVLFSAPVLTHLLLLLLRRDAGAAFFDPLTGLLNRRGLDAAIADRAAGNDAMTAVVIDLDKFKAVNDHYGHTLGDTVLRNTAHAIDTAFTGSPITARTGGEEFLVLTDIDPALALHQAHTLRANISRTPMGAVKVHVTISVGVAHGAEPRTADDIERRWRSADRAMYEAKRAGGDAVRTAETTAGDAPEHRSDPRWSPDGRTEPERHT